MVFVGNGPTHLKLNINRSNLDGGDQGYGSERSPEDELPPILSFPYQTLGGAQSNNHQIPANQWIPHVANQSDFRFITNGNVRTRILCAFN